MSPSEPMIELVGEPALPVAHEAELILPNMRGACVTVGGKVHTLFRFNGRPRASTPGK